MSLEVSKNRSRFYLENPHLSKVKLRKFNLWVQEVCPREMYFCDVDGISFRRSNNRLRVFEYKHGHETASHGQYLVLRELARLIASSPSLEDGSGCFFVQGEPPFSEGAWVYEVLSGQGRFFSRDELVAFVSCQDTPAIVWWKKRNDRP